MRLRSSNPAVARTAALCAVAALVVAHESLHGAGTEGPTTPPRLRLAAATTVEIALAWDAVPGAVSYILERSASAAFAPSETAELKLPGSVTGYGDTGRDPLDGSRFRMGSVGPPAGFRPGATYHYRLKAALAEKAQVLSNPVEASLATKPRRGEPGDLWADVVLGQPDFFQYNYGKLTLTSANLAGGLAIDRRTRPNRVYLVDGNNNRILGLSRVGSSSGSGKPCTTGEDCPAGERCVARPGEVEAEVLIGQPGVNASAANGDATMQAFPGSAPASARSLAMSRSGAVSPGETVVFVNPAVDAEHNLYVPDSYNHRVLMYKDPFDPRNDAAADEVWGQLGDFTTHEVNKGGLSARSLHLRDVMGIDIDPRGNLWVADSFNHRVLRFPRDPAAGCTRTEADVVLGQDDFQHAAARSDDSLSRLNLPVGVRADAWGNIYVLEWGQGAEKGQLPPRLLLYTAESIASSLREGKPAVPAARVLAPKAGDDPAILWMPSSLAYDPLRNGLWCLKVNGTAQHYDLEEDRFTRRVGDGPGHLTGVDVDGAGNVLIVDNWSDETVRRYAARLVDASSPEKPVRWDAHETVFLAKPQKTLDALTGVTGLEILGKQLIVTDKFRLLFWNDYHDVLKGPQAGQAAGGEWCPEADRLHVAYPRKDSRGRLWISTMGRIPAIPGDQPVALRAFEAPLRKGSEPVRRVDASQFETKEGRKLQPAYQDFIYFAPAGKGDRIWIADENSGRVLRLVNVDGEEDAKRGPYVDVVLGKSSLEAEGRQPGGSASGGGSAPGSAARIGADTLWIASGLRLDPEGNLWVLDKPAGDDGMGTRLLKFDARDIPGRPDRTVFGIRAAAVYGTGAQFDAGTACRSGSELEYENAAHPFLPAFDGKGRMVLGTNPYGNSRFGLVYLDYRANARAQLALGDVTGYTFDQTFDPEGNLYLGDWNWNRVLIYKTPLERFGAGRASPGAPAMPGR